jgi:plastocyanin
VGRIAIVAVLATGMLSACASDPSDVPAAAGNAAEAPRQTVTVKSLDNSFREQDITIAVGTEVVFENVGRNEHNVIPDPNSIQGWGVSDTEFGPGATYSHVFTEPGVYAYVCTIHGVKGKGMVGTITVSA